MKIIPLCIAAAIIFTSAILPAALAQSADERAAEGAARREMQFDEETAAEEESDDIHGQVVNVRASERTLIVKEDQYEFEPYQFMISQKTTFEGAESLSDISSGDIVTVDFYVLNGKNIAENVVVEESSFKETKSSPGVEKALVD